MSGHGTECPIQDTRFVKAPTKRFSEEWKDSHLAQSVVTLTLVTQQSTLDIARSSQSRLNMCKQFISLLGYLGKKIHETHKISITSVYL